MSSPGHPVGRARAWSTGCASTTPTGCATRWSTCGGCATAASNTSGSRRSSTPASPCAPTGRCPARSATSSPTTSRRCSSTRRPRTPLTELHAALTGDARPFGEVADEAKLEQATAPFTPEVERLRPAVARGRRRAARGPGRAADLPHLRRARHRARRARRPRGAARRRRSRSARALTLDDPTVPAEFVWRFQQTTPPVMAKGVEDTAFYRYVRLLALNEVGGDPSRFGISVDTFHAATRSARPTTCWSPPRTTPSARATSARAWSR